jgi:hypothetical protein
LEQLTEAGNKPELNDQKQDIENDTLFTGDETRPVVPETRKQKARLV